MWTGDSNNAYCLLGIFGLYISLVYGEGKDYAIKRPQKKVQEAAKDNAGISASNAKTHSRGQEEGLN